MSPERIRPGSARAKQAAGGPTPPAGGKGGSEELELPAATPAGGAEPAGVVGVAGAELADAGAELGPGSQEDDLSQNADGELDDDSDDGTPVALPLVGGAGIDPRFDEPTPLAGPQRGDAPLRPDEFVDLAAAEEVLGRDRVEAYRRGAEPVDPAEIDETADELIGQELLERLAEKDALGEAPGHAGRPRRRHDSAFSRLYHGRTRFDFVRRRRVWFTISSIVILAGAISLATRGLNLGIDFAGGTSWQVRTAKVSVNQARSALTPLGLDGATITLLGADSSTRTLEVEAKLGSGPKTESLAEINKVSAVLAKLADVSPNAVATEQIGPSWGASVTDKAIEALIVFFILISLYISIFFEWRMALAAVVAVAHDVLVVVGIYSLTGFEVTPDTVVAILTILGYSLYDTIVVFDRVRDNVKSTALGGSGRITISDLINLSMNQTLARSINTSLVAIMPIFAVLILGADILGATTLQYFGWALLIGLLSGAYSSIFIASPIVAMLKEREQRYRNIAERLARRGGDRLLLSPEAVATGVFGEGGALAVTRRDQREAAAGGGDGATRSAGGGSARRRPPAGGRGRPGGGGAGPIRPGSAPKGAAPAGTAASPKAGAPAPAARQNGQNTQPLRRSSAGNGRAGGGEAATAGTDGRPAGDGQGGRQPSSVPARSATPGGPRPPARRPKKGRRR